MTCYTGSGNREKKGVFSNERLGESHRGARGLGSAICWRVLRIVLSGTTEGWEIAYSEPRRAHRERTARHHPDRAALADASGSREQLWKRRARAEAQGGGARCAACAADL